MKLKWLGTATLLIAGGSTRILLDPYLRSRSRLAPVDTGEARTAQAIFITHPHLDHFRDVDCFSEGVRPVYVPARGMEIARERGMNVSCMRPIAAGEEVRFGEFTVRAYRGKHCVFDARTVLRVVFSLSAWAHFFSTVRFLKEIEKYRIGADDILVYEISDGAKTVVVLGSAGLCEGEEYPRGADALVFPYQGRYGMHKYLRRFLAAFEPKMTVLDHFDDAFPPLTHTISPKKFIKEMQKRGMEYAVPAEGGWIEL